MKKEGKYSKRTPLFKFAEKHVTVITLLDEKNIKISGKYPIRICITYESKQIYYSPGIDISTDEYERLLAQPPSQKRDIMDLRRKIKNTHEHVESHVRDLLDSSDGFSLDGLNDRLRKGRRNYLADGFNVKIDELKRNGKIGTAEWYFYSLISIQRYDDRDLRYSDVTVKWVKEYEKHLLKQKRSYTTISMYMRALQHIMKKGIEDNIITASQYPFGAKKYKITQGKGRKLALTLQQIGLIHNYQVESEVMERCRDLWYFSYLCNGINMNDMLRLKYQNITGGEIYYQRNKTIDQASEKGEVVAVILPEMQKIINRWGNSKRESDNYIFPFLKPGMDPVEERRIIKNVTSLINKKMGIIGKALGFGNISTYTARHSFATVLKRSGATIEYISESLGHTDTKTTRDYLARFERQERIRQAKKLLPPEPGKLKVVKS